MRWIDLIRGAAVSGLVTMAGAADIHVPADYARITDAVNAASDGDTIIVAPGTYVETAVIRAQKFLTVRSSGGREVTTIQAPTPDDQVVLIAGSAVGLTVLEGFTITGGEQGIRNYVSGVDLLVRDCDIIGNEILSGLAQGAGFSSLNEPNLVTIEDCRFIGNRAMGSQAQGGAAYVGGPTTFRRCLFLGNETGDEGGAVFAGGDPIRFESCEFIGNVCIEDSNATSGAVYVASGSNVLATGCLFEDNLSGAGGVAFVRGSLEMVDCVVRRNHATSIGGAIVSQQWNVRAENTLFVGNTAVDYGGAVYGWSSSSGIQMTNCTFTANEAGVAGGAVFGDSRGCTMHNSIFWGNEPDQLNSFSEYFIPTATYSIVQGGLDGEGNVDADPLFERSPDDGGDGWGDDPATEGIDEGENDDFGDLRPAPGSPAIDAAENAAVPHDRADVDADGDTAEQLPLDLNGSARFADDPGTSDTGSGAAPLVDMGAFEMQADCAADFNGDGSVDTQDFISYLGAWAGDDVSADFNGDGVVDTQDFIAFLNAWSAGC